MVFDLSTLLVNHSIGGTYANGTCGNIYTSTPFQINDSMVTIPDGTAAGTYLFNYYFDATNTCASQCIEMSLIVSRKPVAGTSATVTRTTGDIVPLDLVVELIGEDTGGTWSDTSNSGVSLTNPAAVDISALAEGTYVFTYSLASDTCGPASSTVTLVIEGICPSAGSFVGGDITICIN